MKKLIKTVYHPRYGANTDVTSMRKLAPVFKSADALGFISHIIPYGSDYDKAYKSLIKIHGETYVKGFYDGEEPHASMAFGEWSRDIRDGVFMMHNGQITAATVALESGEIVANVSQGYHHASPEGGSGFCVFNGLANVAALFPDKRIAVLDCDEHGGDGTEMFCATMENLFQFSIHGTPLGIQGGCRSIAVKVRGWEEYHTALDKAFEWLDFIKPDLVLYQAGMDPHKRDPLGRTGLSSSELIVRDFMVFKYLHAKKLPTVFVLAGGYMEPMETELVPLHVNTFLALSHVINEKF